MARIKWTEQDVQYLKNNFNQSTAFELAEHLGRGVATVRSKLWELKLKAVRPKRYEMKQMLHMFDGASVIKGSQAELLETMRSLNAGKITPEHAMAALEIGAYLIESAGDSLESAASLTVPMCESTAKKPHPWRTLDKKTLPEATEPTGVFANVFAPKGGFVPPEIGSVTKVVDGVRK